MLLEHILGIIVISIAYGALWYFVLHGRRTVERVNDNNLKGLREIKKELGMGKEKNG